MGGFGIVLAETTNFKWTLMINCSNEYWAYRLEIEDKRDEHREIELRQSSWNSECDCDADRFKAMDEATQELENEHKKGYEWHKLTEEQKTLTEIFSEIKTLKSENDLL